MLPSSAPPLLFILLIKIIFHSLDYLLPFLKITSAECINLRKERQCTFYLVIL